MEPATRTALVQHLGELTMDAICSVARSHELETENAELRKMVTEERLRVKQLTEALERTQDDVKTLTETVERLSQAPAKSSTRRKTPPLSK